MIHHPIKDGLKRNIFMKPRVPERAFILWIGQDNLDLHRHLAKLLNKGDRRPVEMKVTLLAYPLLYHP